ncbi:MAG: glycosyltransferase family 1 protein [Spirochaetaceae bacterium]|jgi:glycosyltransferase involved in cell wall biosynthesis|nr:glycosyltransferase family 1 protein [Spirochaetaceae bacterium]
MKIAYFTDTFMPELNGVTNTLSKLQTWLDKKNIRYAFFAPDYKRNSATDDMSASTDATDQLSSDILSADISYANADFHHNRIHRFRGIKTSLSPESCLAFPRYREVFELCDKFKPDLVHVVTELGIGYRGMKYARSRGLPLVMSYHTDYCKYLQFFHLDFLRPMIEKYLTWFYRSAHRILAPSRYTLEQLFQKQYRNLGLWSRGIDAEKFNPRFRSRKWRKALGIDDKFVFLYVGRLSPEKGLDMLLYAIEEIETRFPGKAAFVLTGGGPYGDFILKKNFPHVILTGFKTGPELSEIYASADCFAFPSGTETFGNAPLEAMASRLPVAGIASGGVMEFLSHGKNALLCADGDQETFTENLIAIMENKTLRRDLAETGRKLARSRAWDMIFDDLLSVYSGLIADKQNTLGSGCRDAS